MTQVDEILERLRQDGGRVTAARRIVVSALVDTPGPLTAEQLAEIVQAEHPEIHLATIYRTLDALHELGVVQHTHVGHGPAVYSIGSSHQHLVCEVCGEVIDVPPELLDELRATLRKRYKFQLDVGHVALLGRCTRHR